MSWVDFVWMQSCPIFSTDAWLQLVLLSYITCHLLAGKFPSQASGGLIVGVPNLEQCQTCNSVWEMWGSFSMLFQLVFFGTETTWMIDILTFACCWNGLAVLQGLGREVKKHSRVRQRWSLFQMRVERLATFAIRIIWRLERWPGAFS